MSMKVKLPMVLEIDNSGAVKLDNNWKASGQTRHMEMRTFFLREMKETGIIDAKWLRGHENPMDMFTKNLSGPAFDKCAKTFIGVDEHNSKTVTISN